MVIHIYGSEWKRGKFIYCENTGKSLSLIE